MRFLVDECTGPKVAAWLRSKGHDVFDVFGQARGSTDSEIIEKAYQEDRILITNDKDFGEKVFREKLPHHGIILLRLENERTPEKIDVLDRLLTNYNENLRDQIVVVTEKLVRFSKH